MNRLHFVGCLIVLFCAVLMGAILTSRPRASYAFLRSSGVPRTSFNDGTVLMRYFPDGSADAVNQTMSSELLTDGFSKTEQGAKTLFTKGEEVLTLVPHNEGDVSRSEVVLKRPASLLEMIFHPFWDY
jgi:hypothetical protein